MIVYLNTQVDKRDKSYWILITCFTVDYRADLTSECFIDDWTIIVHVKIVSRLWVFESFRLCWLDFHLILQKVRKMEKELLCIMLLERIEFWLKKWAKLFYLLGFSNTVIRKLFDEFVHQVMKWLLFVVVLLLT